ncbi:MAG TPA: helix-turn-helix transcriptional regulator [Spirochaetia bacterium]|nr:helix-turn-helix transcriptional regulator [Spirochaetia bacterium]
MELSERFRKARTYRKLSQDNVATELGISRAKVSALETDGRGITYETVKQFSVKLRFDVRWFFEQLETLEEADLDRRGASLGESTLERIENELKELRAAQYTKGPGERPDQVVDRVRVNAKLHDIVEKLAFLDATVLEKIDGVIHGYLAGKRDNEHITSDVEPKQTKGEVSA